MFTGFFSFFFLLHVYVVGVQMCMDTHRCVGSCVCESAQAHGYVYIWRHGLRSGVSLSWPLPLSPKPRYGSSAALEIPCLHFLEAKKLCLHPCPVFIWVYIQSSSPMPANSEHITHQAISPAPMLLSFNDNKHYLTTKYRL